jgi:hypothetical protein
MSKRRKFSAGQGGFVVPPQGRPPVGGLPGESTEDRDKRVMLHFRQHPTHSPEQVARALGIPLGVARRQEYRARLLAKEAAAIQGTAPKFLPGQLFTPSPPPPATAAERLAAVPDEVKAEIAARYGATFKR